MMLQYHYLSPGFPLPPPPLSLPTPALPAPICTGPISPPATSYCPHVSVLLQDIGNGSLGTWDQEIFDDRRCRKPDWSSPRSSSRAGARPRWPAPTRSPRDGLANWWPDTEPRVNRSGPRVATAEDRVVSENSILASRRQLVLVDQSAQPVVSTNLSCDGAGGAGVSAVRWSPPGEERVAPVPGSPERPLVRAMAVVVAGVAAKDAFEMSFIENQQMVEALRSDGADEPFGKGVRIRGPKGVLRISAPSASKTSSKPATYLVSRSRTKNLAVISASARSPVTFLACWVTQAALGWAVTPVIQTLRRPSSMKKRT